MRVRVLRLMEYVYDSPETAQADQERWQVQGVFRPHSKMIVRSTILSPELLPDDDPELLPDDDEVGP